MFGSMFLTHRNYKNGIVCNKVHISEKIDIDQELYVGLYADRINQCPTFILSPTDGCDVEMISLSYPEKIFKISVDFRKGLVDD
jgi:succinyl-CoA synthetase beta subunit